MDNNQKQLEGMRDALESYLLTHEDFSALIKNLEILESGLHGMTDSWKADFRTNWGQLEQVYSVATVYGESVESAENQAIIKPAVENLTKIVIAALVSVKP